MVQRKRELIPLFPETKEIKCPACGDILIYLMLGRLLYCKRCEKCYKNDNGNVGEETVLPYIKKDN